MTAMGTELGEEGKSITDGHKFPLQGILEIKHLQLVRPIKGTALIKAGLNSGAIPSLVEMEETNWKQ